MKKRKIVVKVNPPRFITKRIKEIAKVTNLTESKVANVILAMYLGKS